MDNLLILTEAGEGIGFGHLSRCSALRSYFIQQQVPAKISLSISPETPNFKGWDGEFEASDWLNEIDSFGKLSKLFDCVLVDSYLAPVSVYNDLKKKFKKIFVIDDYNRIAYPADVLINPNVYGDQIDYSNQEAKILAGREFVILREIFREHLKGHTTQKKSISKIALTLGGSDVHGILPLLISSLLKMNIRLDVIAGNENRKTQIQDRFSKESNLNVFGFLDAASMFNIYQQADLVVCGGGQTLHELAGMGKPAVAIRLGDDQIQNMNYYFGQGFILGKPAAAVKKFEEEVMELIRRFEDQKIREQVSGIGKGILSGDGVSRIFHELYNV